MHFTTHRSALGGSTRGVPIKQSGECAAIVAKFYADVELAGAGTCHREGRVHDLEAMQEGDAVLVT